MYTVSGETFTYGLSQNGLQVPVGGRRRRVINTRSHYTSPRRPCCFKEGWALRAAKKAYRFSDKQKSYLQAKFRIGQTTGRKLDAEIVAREMRRARGPDGKRLFQASEFLAASQVASFFSRQSAAVRQSVPDEMDIQAI